MRKVCVQLCTSADNVALPEFAATRLVRTAGLCSKSIDIFCPLGPQQRTRCSDMWQPNAGTDRSTPDH